MTSWLERWQQRDDDELLYGDQSDVTLEDLARLMAEPQIPEHEVSHD